MNPKKTAAFLTITAAFCMNVYCGQVAVAQENQTIVILEGKKVVGKKVFLGEVSEITGDMEFIQKVEKIDIGRAALPGETRNFKRNHIITRLKQHDIDVKEINLDCPREIKVETDAIEYSQDELKEMTRKYILEYMTWNPEWVKIDNFIVNPVLLPEGDVQYRFSTKENEDFVGRFNGEIDFTVNDTFYKKVRVSAIIHVIAPVAILSRYVDKHEIIVPDKVSIERRDITYTSKNVIMDLNDAVGKMTTNRMDAGTVLKSNMIESAPIVKKGDLVTIVLETDSFIITSPGKALENGCKGDLIEVSNITSKNKVYGYVNKSDEVRVRF